MINFLKKIENLQARDKISLFVGMIAFLILVNFADFSQFKASILETGTGEIIETIEEIKTEEISENITETDIEKEILESEIENLKQETSEIEISENGENITISENSQTGEFLEGEVEIIENPILSENSSEISATSNTGETLEEFPSENTENFLETVDKNLETLKKLEEEENQKIEIISDIEKEEIIEEKIGENIDENENFEESEIDKEISATLQQIEEIEIQKKAEELAMQMIQEQEKKVENNGLSEDDFMVSGEETEAYNEMIRNKKEQEIRDEYEKKLKEFEEKTKNLIDTVEMLENKLKTAQEKTPEEIAAEQEQISEREKAKREAEEKLKILEAEKAEKLRLANIEKEKRQVSLDKFNKDSDGDGLSDHIEKIIETNEKLIDTDGDGYSDKTEIDKFFNPNGEGNLFSDISEKSRNKNKIISGTKKGLVFIRAGDKFLENEEIYRNEAIKIIVSAIYPTEIYREDEFFEGIELYSDVSSSDDYARYLAIAIKHGILDGIIADNFDPYSTFSKAEFVKIVINAIGKGTSDKKIKWVDTEYDNWFTPYFSKAKELGIIQTETFNRIFPLKNITRIEAIEYCLEASKYWN